MRDACQIANACSARLVAFACLAAAVLSSPAFAYRPFDGTDAAVAHLGEFEVEFQPADRLRDDTGTSLVAPDVVLNYGMMQDWEAVVEGRLQEPLSPSGPTTLTAAGAFLKHVLVPGVLQDKSGPSVATEFGVLLPDSNGPDSGIGASVAGIVSQRWDWGTVHFTAEAAITREHSGDVLRQKLASKRKLWALLK